MLGADPVMDAVDPGLQVGKDQVDDRQEFLCDLWVSAFGDCVVVESALAKASIAAPVVGNDQRSGSDGVFNESTERISTTVGDASETNTSRIATVFPIVEFGSRLPVTHLYGARDENLVMHAPAFASGPSSDPRFIHFNMFLRLAANLVVVGAHHPGAELMKDAEGRLIARQAELPLKLDGRHSGRLAGDQVSRPEPGRQRCVTALHYGSGHQADVFATGAAAQNAGARLEAEWLADNAAPWAGEPTLPAGLFEIRGNMPRPREKCAGIQAETVGKAGLHAPGYPWPTLNLVGVGVKRIGKPCSCSVSCQV